MHCSGVSSPSSLAHSLLQELESAATIRLGALRRAGVHRFKAQSTRWCRFGDHPHHDGQDSTRENTATAMITNGSICKPPRARCCFRCRQARAPGRPGKSESKRPIPWYQDQAGCISPSVRSLGRNSLEMSFSSAARSLSCPLAIELRSRCIACFDILV